MITKSIQKKYLKITAFVVGSFGPIFFLGTMLNSSTPAAFTLDLLSFPLDGHQNYNASTTRFLSALTGGFLFGWGVTIYCLQKWVYDFAPEAVRKTVLAGILSWFFLDSLGSVTSGNSVNALFNILVLIIAVGPLWKGAKE